LKRPGEGGRVASIVDNAVEVAYDLGESLEAKGRLSKSNAPVELERSYRDGHGRAYRSCAQVASIDQGFGKAAPIKMDGSCRIKGIDVDDA
jgi:hypothetical protein